MYVTSLGVSRPRGMKPEPLHRDGLFTSIVFPIVRNRKYVVKRDAAGSYPIAAREGKVRGEGEGVEWGDRSVADII